MAEYINPFDFRKIFIDIALGTPEIFLFVFVLVYSFFAGKYRFPNLVYLSVLAVGLILFSFVFGASWYILIILIIGFIVFKGIAKILT